MWGSLSGSNTHARTRRGLRLVSGSGFGVVLACAMAASAGAQESLPEVAPEYQYVPDLFEAEIPRGETVRSRQRPELDPLGLRLGGFLFFPSITNGITYDDNVFATENDKRDDFLYTLTPQVQARSDWNRHSLSFGAGGTLGFYFDETEENYQDAFGTVAGRVDVSSSTILRGRASVRRQHEQRGDPNEPAGVADPTVFMSFEGGLDGSHRFNRVTVSVGNDVLYRQYDDSELVGGGTLDNSDRDYLELRPGVKVAYEFSPALSAFLRGQGNFVRYKDRVDSGGFERDSKGYDVVAGASMDFTGLLFGDFFAGIRQRFFEDPSFDTITGPVAGSTLTWIPTALTTVNLSIESQIIESANSASSGYNSSAIGVGVDHELLRNLILNANAGFRYDDFEGISRTDKFYTAGAGADYLLNRYLTLGARYVFQKRDSDASGNDYTRNLFSLSVKAQL